MMDSEDPMNQATNLYEDLGEDEADEANLRPDYFIDRAVNKNTFKLF